MIVGFFVVFFGASQEAITTMKTQNIAATKKAISYIFPYLHKTQKNFLITHFVE